MRVGILIAAVMALAPLTSGAQEVVKQFQFFGFSSVTVTGDVGVFGLSNTCKLIEQASRVCTSEEVMNTIGFPTTLTGQAWVRPVFVASSQEAADSSGVADGLAVDLTCSGWNGGSSGLSGHSEWGIPQGAMRRRSPSRLLRPEDRPRAHLHADAAGRRCVPRRAQVPGELLRVGTRVR